MVEWAIKELDYNVATDDRSIYEEVLPSIKNRKAEG